MAGRRTSRTAPDPPPRTLITGGNPDAPFPIPAVEAFDMGEDYLDANALTKVAEALIKAHPIVFGHLVDAPPILLWRKRGGTMLGEAVLSKTTKLAGLARHFGGTSFVTWLAADHLRERTVSAYTVEALVAHELCHIGHDVESGKRSISPHEFEGFGWELAHYGLWSSELQFAARQFGQIPLPLEAAAASEPSAAGESDEVPFAEFTAGADSLDTPAVNGNGHGDDADEQAARAARILAAEEADAIGAQA